MGTVWFCLVAVMIAMYVLLDGFDLGAGAIHFLVAKTREERRQVIATIGPVWDGNEVWLLAAGGTLYFAFPALYASAFSGFYLPLMMVLWLLILRGLAIEFRNHVKSEVWTPLWDFLFCGASLLLAIFYGAALGNVVRGVPLDASGYFFEPLWTDWRLGLSTGVLDWYTVIVGVVALMVLIMHGSLWVQLKSGGAVQQRSGALAGRTWWVVVVLTVLVTIVTFRVQTQILSNFSRWPLAWILPVLAVVFLATLVRSAFGFGEALVAVPLLAVKFALVRRREMQAFLSSCAYLVGMLTSVVFGVYPMVLPARDGVHSLTVADAAAHPYGLKIGLVWWSLGMLLAAGYFTMLYRSFAGKSLEDEHG